MGQELIDVLIKRFVSDQVNFLKMNKQQSKQAFKLYLGTNRAV